MSRKPAFPVSSRRVSAPQDHEDWLRNSRYDTLLRQCSFTTSRCTILPFRDLTFPWHASVWPCPADVTFTHASLPLASCIRSLTCQHFIKPAFGAKILPDPYT